MEKKEKTIKTPKAPKTPKEKKAKASKYPEWYIGRPKPMKTKTFEFHKPTAKFYVGLGFTLAILGFLTYIVLRLIQVGSVIQPEFEFYEYSDKTPETFVLENDYLKLEMDSKTTQFTVLQKNTGKVWRSNPEGAQQDPIALTKEKNNMMSTFLIKYSTQNGTDEIYDTYGYSIKRNFYNLNKANNEITVNYTIGQMDREYIFPLAIYGKELAKWQEGLTKSQQNALARSYHKYSVETIRDPNELEAMLTKYPEMEDDDIYLVFENIKKFQKEQTEELFAKQGYTYDDYLRHKELYKEVNIKEMPAFCISVKFKLDKNDLIVTIPFDEIAYRVKYPLIQLSVLPYFGAGGSSDEGFLFVPEGGGAVINFNNGKVKQNGYYADVYGWDTAVDRKAVITETKAAFPVFGVSNGNSSFISIIENGAEYAGVTAEIAGKLGSYNYARADYTMLHREQYEITSRNIDSQFSYEPNLPKGEQIKQVFKFVDSSSYVDMAKSYRDYLFKGNKKQKEDSVPVTVELVGAIEKVQQVLGMPKTKPFKLTDYNEAGEIIYEIDSLGIKNVNYKLSGFINGGVKPTLLKKIKFIKALGGKSDFNKFVKDTKEISANLYLDSSVQSAYRSGMLKGFNKYKHSSRFVSDELCELYEYSPLWYGKMKDEDSYFLVNPALAALGSDNLAKTAKKFGLKGISYKDNGSQLAADYNDRNLITRGVSKQMQIDKMKSINEQDLGIIVNYGNDYALDYVDFVTNMPLHGNSYAIIDYSVPFYQIALHGNVDYSGKSINLSYDITQSILEAAETASALSFTFMKASETELHDTSYTEYYSASFAPWKTRFAQLYSDYNKEISKVYNSKIDNHKYVTEQVTQTKFDNGYSVLVNFGYTDFVTASGIKVPARNYKVVKVEE